MGKNVQASGKAERGGLFTGIVRLVTTLCLAAGLVGAGLFVCCLPQTTAALSTGYSQWQGSPLSQEDMVKAALATQDYTVGSHSRASLQQALYEIAAEVVAGGGITDAALSRLLDAGAVSTDEVVKGLMASSDTVALPDSALSHLDDVYQVVSTTRIALAVVMAAALLGCVLIGLLGGRRKLGKTLMCSAAAVLVLFILLALWVVLDFNGFFAFFHSLFFANGTWTFPANSLLIRMYPEGFWIGMGVVWLVSSCLASLLCLIIGWLIKGRRKYRL